MPDRSLAETGVRLGGAADRQAPSWLAPAPARESDARVRQAAQDVHALRWFTDEAFRRRIGRQLNLGESLNDLRRFIFFAHRGKVGYPRHDDQTTQAHCHSLVVNACVLSTTGYPEDAIAAQRVDGRPVSDEVISHLSPGQYEPINPYGTLNFDVANVVKRPRRPLRRL
ncbi:MAG TPA: Tn3 family transposase [Solirubrobacteraceae bacterium]